MCILAMKLRTVGLIVAVAFRSPGTKNQDNMLLSLGYRDGRITMVWVVSVYPVECAVGSHSKFLVQWLSTSHQSFSIGLT